TAPCEARRTFPRTVSRPAPTRSSSTFSREILLQLDPFLQLRIGAIEDKGMADDADERRAGFLRHCCSDLPRGGRRIRKDAPLHKLAMGEELLQGSLRGRRVSLATDM